MDKTAYNARWRSGGSTMVILALDVGQARIGLAVSDPTEFLATPHAVIQRRSTASAVEAVARAVAEVGAEQVLIGLPISLDGALHQQAEAARSFGSRIEQRLQMPIVYWDERYSTVAAAEALRAAGVRPERMKERIDAVAAAMILQDYLDHRRGERTSGQSTAETGASS
ncbi:MAG TPA: Holliday junction resolvase RuvX [Ktedonobacterales bacterium]